MTSSTTGTAPVPGLAAPDDQARLSTAFAAHLGADPDATALVVGSVPHTRAELAERSRRAAGALLERGLRPGDPLVVQYGSDLDDMALALAASTLGLVFVPIPSLLGPYEVAYILDLVRPAVFGAHAKLDLSTLEVPDGVAALRSADLVGAPDPGTVAEAPEPADHTPIVGFTSGTTGRPKGVVHTMASVRWAARFAASIADVQPGEAIGLIGAGGGAPGYTFFSYLGLANGSPIVRPDHWDPGAVLDLWEEHGVVWSMLVPTMLYMLLEEARQRPRPVDLSRFRALTLGGAAIKPELIRRARSELGIEVVRMYGLSECMGAVSMRRDDAEEDRDTLDGRPGPGSAIAVFDEQRRPVPVGVEGETGLKGPSLLVSYLGDDEAFRAQVTDDGYFLTGDLGVLDERGYVRIVGRKKDMIIRGGLNIDPSEVEQLLRRHDAVADAAVVSYPDDRLGERCCAVLLLRAGAEVGFDDVISFLRSQGLATAKLPEKVEVSEAFPLSPDGKVLKPVLREQHLRGELAPCP